jgi:hypothetical protein
MSVPVALMVASTEEHGVEVGDSTPTIEKVMEFKIFNIPSSCGRQARTTSHGAHHVNARLFLLGGRR